jgi:chromosome segregation protein
LIRATLGRGVGFDDLVGKFRAAITGSGVRGTKIEAIFDQMRSSDDPITTWESLLAELEPGKESATKTAVVPTPTLFGLGLSAADVGHMKERITPDGWLDLALTPLRDRPSFDYQTKPGEYIPFSSASAGQQATALLTILLNQAGPPLVIDQPEDDLDSQIVLEIVEQIWRAKTRRQLVFASHNPNLVVNGDAELLICCDYRAAGDHSGGRIKLEGAIDVPKVKAEITTVMEGGEKAFRLRKEKYGF